MKTSLLLSFLLSLAPVLAGASEKAQAKALSKATLKSQASVKAQTKVDVKAKAQAKANTKAKAKVAPMNSAQQTKSSLTTDAQFGDQSVSGKYQVPLEALSVVENEKTIDDLIGVRKNFRDRITKYKGMR